MWRYRSTNNNTMFVKLLLSMTAIAVVTVILIATVTYSISADNSIQNSIGYNESILTQQQELIHKELAAIKNAAIGMIMTQSYLYHTIDGRLSVGSLIDLAGFVEEQKKISPYIDSIYLYYAPLGLVVTSRPEVKTSPISTFADSSWLDVWKQESESRTLWITGRPNGFAPDRPAAGLIQKMPLIGQVEGAIVINLKLDLLFADFLSHYHNKKGTTLVLGPRGEILFSESATGEALLKRLDLGRLSAGSGSYIDDSNRIVSYTTSGLTGWSFVDITERSVLLQGMNRIKYIVFVVAVIYITAAFAISFYLSRRLYRPLQSVISYISGSESTDRDNAMGTPPAGDEAGFIRHIFEQLTRNKETLMREKRKVDSLLTDNRTAIKEKYLNDLIQGGGKSGSDRGSEHAAELLGLRVDFTRFAVLTMELEEPYPLKGPDGAFHFHLFHYGLMEELEARVNGEIFAKDDKRTVILLSVPSEEEDYPLEQAKELKEQLLARYGLSVTIAVSRVYSGKASVRAAYEDTLEALNLKIYIGKGEILPYSILDIGKAEEEAYYYPYGLETKLLQALLQTDMEVCTAAIRQVTRTVIEKKLSKANIQQLYFQLSGEIVKALVQAGGDMSAAFGERPSCADALARAETLQDMEVCLLDMCSRIIAYHREKRSKMTDVTLQLATDYMNENFNKNISVDTIAEYVQRSSSYLSRIFKDATGMTVNDYLIQLRIKRAMELLKLPHLSMEEICREIGYANVSYFSKLFKSRSGLTPGQFRHQQAADQLLAQGKEQPE
ncbi:helix-turn-helix domain-containing protein [Paenibacillus sp. GD4]|uniref:helix-turn-helix domain-containing protein n=1 Tax=Paenibacillus sp. GD4 TaxID=3068890 RepID=UPI0027967264|nr:helix-turn-helix domain-containing protein [Paenibacillus sp. GD4]MDQ1913681.1 helix-turn-helix domain-containing protein [Paenibacillus sp. GD4]